PAGPAARAPRGVAVRGIRLEPVRPLPAGFLTEGAAKLDQARVGRGEAQRPTGLPLLERIVDVVVRGVNLGGAGQAVRARAVLIAEAPDVHLPQVELRLAVDDPLRDLASQPAGPGDAVRREPCRDEEAA